MTEESDAGASGDRTDPASFPAPAPAAHPTNAEEDARQQDGGKTVGRSPESEHNGRVRRSRRRRGGEVR